MSALHVWVSYMYDRMMCVCVCALWLHCAQTEEDTFSLFHAASLGFWGIHDRTLLLTQAVMHTLTDPKAQFQIYDRWSDEMSRSMGSGVRLVSEGVGIIGGGIIGGDIIGGGIIGGDIIGGGIIGGGHYRWGHYRWGHYRWGHYRWGHYRWGHYIGGTL